MNRTGDKVMSEIENIRVLAEVASESGAYEDSYKYSSKILELDINDAKAWIDKGIAAAFLTDSSGSRIGECRALVKKGIELGVDESSKSKAINKIKLAYNNYCNQLNDELLGKVKDFQKVGMPAGGSALLHGLGQAANKLLTAKGQAASRVKGLELLLLLCEVKPTADSYELANIALANALAHSKANGNYLDGDEAHCTHYREIRNQITTEFKNRFPQAAATSLAKTTKSDGCFIATAATGSYDHPKVLTLRQYRDDVLLPNEFGRRFVSFYYAISPSIAKHVARSEVLRSLVMKAIVNPAVKYVDKNKTK
jgi:hypothetical protein